MKTESLKLSRLLLILRYTAFTEGKSLIYSSLVLSILSCIIGGTIAYNDGIMDVHNIFLIGQLVGLIIMVLGNFFKQLKSTGDSIAYLQLPVSVNERFLVIVVWSTIILPLVHIIIYMTLSYILDPIAEYITGGVIMPLYINADSLLLISSTQIIIPLFLYGAICFKQYAPFKTLLATLTSLGIYMSIFQYIVRRLMGIGVNFSIYTNLSNYIPQYIVRRLMGMGVNFSIYTNLSNYIPLVLVLWVMIYFAIKEREV